MSVQMLLNATPFGVRGAVLKDETPIRLLHFFQSDTAPRTGDLYWAKVGRRDPRLGALVCDLGEAGEGLLTVKDRAYTEGQLIPAAIRREGIGGKRPLLTDKPLLKLPAATRSLQDDAVTRPGPLGQLDVPAGIISSLRSSDEGPGRMDSIPPLVRLVTGLASSATDEIVCSSADTAAALSEFVPTVVDVLVSDQIPSVLNDIEDDALARTVALESGGALIIDQAEALTAIDLDLGASAGQSKKGADAGLLRRALMGLGPILSLHGLGGQVVLDLPRGATRTPKMIRDQLTAALKPYGLMNIPAVTKEGLVVMIFGQDRMPVIERLTEVFDDAHVLPGRKLRSAALAQRAFAQLTAALKEDPRRKLRLTLGADTAALWQEADATAVLARSFTERFTIEPSNAVDFQIETAP